MKKCFVLVLFIMWVSLSAFSQSSPGGISIQPYAKGEKDQTSYLDAFWKPKSFDIPLTTETSSLLNGVVPNVVVSVYVSDTIAKVLPTQFGVNSNFRSGSSILGRLSIYTQAKFGEFRFPAGSGSNSYFWDGVIPTNLSEIDPVKFSPIDGTKSTEINPAVFAQLLTDTKAQANIVVNYFYARYGKTDLDDQPGATDAQKRTARVKQAADYAAGFVRKMNIELNAKVLNWEIGNECYGKWERGYMVNGISVTGKEYGEDFKVFAAAMKAVDPTIKVGAVVDKANVIWSGQVLTQVKDVADFLIVHEYFTAENKATPSNVLASITAIKANADTLNNWVLKYAGKPKGFYPIALTEFNSRGYSTSNMVNGMFFASVLGEIIKNKYGFSTSWVNEWSKGTDFSTHGLIATNDDPSQPPYSPRPAYMPYFYYGKYFGDHMVNSTVSGNGVNVYSSVFSGGEVGLVIVNTNSTEQLVQLNMNSNKFDNGKAYWHEMYATDIEKGNTRFYINGRSGNNSGGGPENFTEIPPYQANFVNNVIFKVKKYSVNYINLTKGISTSLKKNLHPSFLLTPNPVSDILTIRLSSDQPANIEFMDLSGTRVLVVNDVVNSISIPTNRIGNIGIYMVKINNTTQKIIIQ